MFEKLNYELALSLLEKRIPGMLVLAQTYFLSFPPNRIPNHSHFSSNDTVLWIGVLDKGVWDVIILGPSECAHGSRAATSVSVS